ncbi:hypothetical protein CC99x_005145 [Candidatus Berkiella cookevillensis]|uniref:Ankyrin repeats (3 copies) n=1 Tax=Candidatus Berkiella cookevillensis TaxID=437022 RepID=A0A0Q9YVN8_9GAMM|nr:hypothetical protein [Candidatus Berkiella cookevillensis]MCS5708286.1 hypothetical protein [Candidatus Berkiella cookevillensis]
MSYKIRALLAAENQLFDRIMSLCEKKYGHIKVSNKFDELGVNAPHKTILGIVHEVLKLKNYIKNPASKSKISADMILSLANKNVSHILMSLGKAAQENKSLQNDKDYHLIIGFLLILSTHLAMNSIALHAKTLQKNEEYIRLMLKGGTQWVWSYERDCMALVLDKALQNFKKTISAYYLEMFSVFYEDFKLPHLSLGMMRALVENRTTEANQFDLAFNGEVVGEENPALVRITSINDSVLEYLSIELNNIFYAKSLIARRQFMVYLNHEQGNILYLDAFYDQKSHKLIIICGNIDSIDMQHQFLEKLSRKLAAQEIDASIYSVFFKDLSSKSEHVPFFSYYMMKASSKMAFDQKLSTLLKPICPMDNLSEVPYVTWVICEDLSKALDTIYVKQDEYMYRQMLNISLLGPMWSKACEKYFSMGRLDMKVENLEKIKERYGANSLSQAIRRGAAGKHSIAEFRALLQIGKADEMNKRDDTPSSRKSALHHAVINQKLKRALLLSEKRADTVSKDFQKKSARDYFEGLPLNSPLKENTALCYYFEHQKPMFLWPKTKVGNNEGAKPKNTFMISAPIKMKAEKQEKESLLEIDFSKFKI